MKTCTTEGCTRPAWARGFCAPHYSTWHRAQLKYTVVCDQCGKTARMPGPTKKYCSRTCSAKANQASATAGRVAQMKAQARGPEFSQCGWCNALHAGRAKYCCSGCRTLAAKDEAQKQWSPLRRALVDGDHSGVIAAIRARCTIDDDGCWHWTNLHKSYPVFVVDGVELAVHRLSLEAKHGRRLGSQAAHHMCAVTSCVNPDHLQPVTHAENNAEMLGRRAFITRIAELETTTTRVVSPARVDGASSFHWFARSRRTAVLLPMRQILIAVAPNQRASSSR